MDGFGPMSVLELGRFGSGMVGVLPKILREGNSKTQNGKKNEINAIAYWRG